MSLLSFLNEQEVRDKLNEISNPNPKLNDLIKATSLSKNYGIVGTAFDYLLRFNVEFLNKNVEIKKNEWVAENGLALLRKKHNQDTISALEVDLSKTKESYSRFLTLGAIDAELCEAVIFLSKLDIYVRSRYDSFLNYTNEFFQMSKKILEKFDIEDLKNLYNIIEPEIFKAKNIVFLNPTFGEASKMIGGADADLIIDSVLIDIKVTKELKLKRAYFNQLIGYYVLSMIGGINDMDHKIEHLGIYFARHGVLWKIPTSEIASHDKFIELRDFFVKSLNGRYNHLRVPKKYITIK